MTQPSHIRWTFPVMSTGIGGWHANSSKVTQSLPSFPLKSLHNDSTIIHAFLTHTFTFTHKHQCSLLPPTVPQMSSQPIIFFFLFFNLSFFSYLSTPPPRLHIVLTITLMTSCVSFTVHPFPWNLFTFSLSCAWSNHCSRFFSSSSSLCRSKPHVHYLHPTSAPVTP